MSYIGNQPPDIGAYDFESFDGGGTSFTLKRSATVSSVLLFIDGVRQTPTDAYTVSGVTLTTTGTTPAGTDNVTVMFMGDVVDIGAPSADTVSTAKIQDDAVTAAKLANSINTEIAANTAKVTNATHTGDVTGATALTIATDAVDIAMLSATGTASASTFLRGDNAWASAGGDNTPRFQAYLSANQDPAASTWVKVQFNAELYDTDGAYDPTTNYRFTVPTGEGGTYFLYSNVTGGDQGSGSVTYFQLVFHKNGSSFTGGPAALMNSGANSRQTAKSIQTILTLVEDDYIEIYGQISTGSGNARYRGPDTMAYCSFGGYKLL